MIEAQQGSAHLEDIGENVFLCFAQFAYKGDYKGPELDTVLSQSDVEWEPPKPSDGSAWETGFDLQKKKRKKQVMNGWASDTPVVTKGAVLWESFKAKADLDSSASQQSSNQDHGEEYTSIFLCHASLYVFADRYGIGLLGELAIKKLRRVLSRFTLHAERTNDIVELVKYIYANTMDLDTGIDRLRDLISDYVVCHLEKIVKDEAFSKLLQENGDVAKDLMPKITQRLD